MRKLFGSINKSSYHLSHKRQFYSRIRGILFISNIALNRWSQEWITLILHARKLYLLKSAVSSRKCNPNIDNSKRKNVWKLMIWALSLANFRIPCAHTLSLSLILFAFIWLLQVVTLSRSQYNLNFQSFPEFDSSINDKKLDQTKWKHQNSASGFHSRIYFCIYIEITSKRWNFICFQHT